MSLETWVLDFETYFDSDYSLSKMTTEAYVRDPRFEPLMLGYRDPTGQRGWVGQEDISYFLRQINWDVSAILAHHAHFDGLIFSHHYGVKPAMWFDTLSMARQCHNNEKMSVSLDSLAKFYGLEAKKVPYDQFKGKRWYQIDPALRQLLGEGAEHDCGLTFDIFAQMARTFSAELYPLVDITVRMFTEPAFDGDAALFDKISGEEMRRKYEILNRLQVTEKDLASNDKFTAILEEMGVEVEYKTGTKGLIPAIAATDDFLRALIDDPDEELSTLAQARVDVKSTIAQTRSARLADMSRRGPLCVYLNFAGAQNTLRWSGGDKLNFQNFPRIDRVEKKIENPLQLRLGVRAPQGKIIAIADQSQIECRLLNRVAGQWDMVERFKLKQDPYVGVASKFYGREITKADEKERGTGKQLELSCGYGAGDKTIQDTAKKGTYGPPVFMTIEEAALAKSIYRDSHQAVVDLWREGDRVLHALAHKGTMIWRDVVEIKDGKIYGPNGSWLTYNLTWDDEWRAWMRHTRKGRKKIWGGHLVENLIQWLAWITMGQAIVRIQKTTGFRPATSSHDEGVWLLNDDPNAQLYLEYFLGEMRRCPTWLPDTPLDAEGKLSYVYDK